MSYFADPQNVQELDKITAKILRAETPGIRGATLVDAHHVVEGKDIISFVVYDKSPVAVGDALQHERRWVVVVTLKDEEVDRESWSISRGIVSLWWEGEEEEPESGD